MDNICMTHTLKCSSSNLVDTILFTCELFFHHRGYGATAARLTPDQKVGSSNLSALIANASAQ